MKIQELPLQGKVFRQKEGLAIQAAKSSDIYRKCLISPAMKLLLIYCSHFSYQPNVQSLEMADPAQAASFTNVQTAFIQAEEEDVARESEVAKKVLKNIKWVCGKNNTRKVVLHSFAHLSESKADPAFTKQLFDHLQERLTNTDYEVSQTPFGHFLDLNMQAPGLSLARVFKSL